jgi:putative Holliday junction resolvase
VAISDAQGILATPLTVLASEDNDALINDILSLVEQHKVGRVVIGLPRRLSGELGKQASKVTAFSERLSCSAKNRNLSQLDIQLWDERLSTKAAERLKTRPERHGGNVHLRGRRGGRNQNAGIKAEVDAIAAALILQGFLDSQRREDSEES